MNIEIIISVITALSSGGLIGMFLERRKRKVETEIIEADFNDKMRQMYLKFVDDFNVKYESLREELENIRQQNEDLKKQNEELKRLLKFRTKNKLKKKLIYEKNNLDCNHSLIVLQKRKSRFTTRSKRKYY